MIPQYTHNLLTSYMLWLDWTISNKGQAYININNGPMYLQADQTVNGNTWVSPYRSWIYDSSVSGANIISGVYNASGQYLTRQSGIVIDYINGRIISPYNWGAQLSGNYAKKEINVYLSSENEASFVLEQVFNENINLNYPLTGFQGKGLVAPFVILTNATEHNDPFALGGLDRTRNKFRAFIITKDNYTQEGVNSLIRDSARQAIPMASYADAPISTSGDLKTGYYSFVNNIQGIYGCQNLYIDEVHAFKVNEKTNRNQNFFISVLEIDISLIRMPRG